MDVLRSLIDEIMRLQLLVCAQRSERRGSGTVALDDVARELRCSGEECGRVVGQLRDEGLLEPAAGAETGSVRLTARGREVVRHSTRREPSLRG